MSDAIILSEYAVEFRYPDDFLMPEHEETKTAFKIALNLKKFVLTKLDVT